MSSLGQELSSLELLETPLEETGGWSRLVEGVGKAALRLVDAEGALLEFVCTLPAGEPSRVTTGLGVGREASAVLQVPLGEPRSMGTLTVVRGPGQRPFTPTERTTLADFARAAAMVIRSWRYHAAATQAQVEADQATRSKLSFLSNLSHELRTPLNGILGFSHLLEASSLNANQRSMVSTIVDSGHRLLNTIENILDLAHFEAGTVSLDQLPFSPRGLLERSIAKYQTATEAKNVEWAVHIDESVPAVVEGDAIHLGRAWDHLLSNASKFTARGSITVQLHARPVGMGTVELAFEVEDTGIGLASDRTGHWFSPFHQEDGSLTRKFNGTGLGLALCDRLVRSMGGGLSLLGEPGVGTKARAWVTLVSAGS